MEIVITANPNSYPESKYDIFCLVFAGEFTMGNSFQDAPDNEKPQRRIQLSSFCISKYPVTNDQYACFLRECLGRSPSYWRGYRYDNYLSNHPVDDVSWEDACRYCDWLSNKTEKKVLLPTEAQWEKAARGEDKREFPWGNQRPDFGRVNFANNENGSTPVDLYPKGVSPYGCWDMAGNVNEWTRDYYADDWLSKMPLMNPVNLTPIDNPIGMLRTTRGGHWSYGSQNLTTTTRWGIQPSAGAGFRCVYEMTDNYKMESPLEKHKKAVQDYFTLCGI